MCLCDLLVTNTLTILTSRIITRNLTGKVGFTETYTTAKPDALVDKVPVDVVVPFDAVQVGSSADHRGTSE